MTVVFNGDFETGNKGNWDGVSDKTTYPLLNAGLASVVASHTPAVGPVITPALGNYFSWQELKPPLGGQSADRAEYQEIYSWAAYDGQTYWYTFAILLDPDFDWSSAWCASATNAHFHPVIFQLFYRNPFPTCLVILHPIGWQGNTAMTLSISDHGGLISAGPQDEHRMAIDPAAGNGYDTLMSPTLAASSGAQRDPIIAGQHTFLAGDRPLTTGVWHQFKIQAKMVTTTNNGFIDAWHKVKGSGVEWVKTYQSGAVYKTQVYDLGSSPAHADGADDRHAGGGYVYGLPQPIHFGFDQPCVFTTEAEADAKFQTEGGGGTLQPPAVQGGHSRLFFIPSTDVMSAITADRVRTSRRDSTPTQAPILIDKVYAKLSGAASGGAALHKFVVYADSAGAPASLVGSGPEVSVVQGAATAWVDVSPASPIAVTCPCHIGLHTGGAGGNAGLETGSPGYKFATDTYADGIPNPAPAMTDTSPATELGLVADYTVVSAPPARFPGGRTATARVAQDGTHMHVAGTGGGL